jgi:hypothetical protein
MRSFSSTFDTVVASTEGSILVPLSRAISLSRCRQSGACRCNGGHRVYGSEIILGICSCIGASRVDITGPLNPIAEMEGIKGGMDNIIRKHTNAA